MTDQYANQGEEMGATVRPPDYYVYQYVCTECGSTGAEFNTEGEAQGEGWSHQSTYHPPAATYTVRERGKYA